MTRPPIPVDIRSFFTRRFTCGRVCSVALAMDDDNCLCNLLGLAKYHYTAWALGLRSKNNDSHDDNSSHQASHSDP